MTIYERAPDHPLPASEVYPLAYGTEEETGMLDNHRGQMDEPTQLAGDLGHYLPADLEHFDARGAYFLQNGSKIYAGGAADYDELTNIERATAECISPEQVSLCLRASEILLIKTVSNYLTEISVNQPEVKTTRIQRRVIDSYGNRKGCHDNFGISPNSPIALHGNLPPAVLTHLASRSFITGAGLITEFGTNLAQKVGGLEKAEGYGNFGTMYRMTTVDGTPRVEIRCNDINLSDWATEVRLGSTALAIALNQTALGSKLQGMTRHESLQMAQRMNDIKLSADGLVQPSDFLNKAVDFQQAQADLVLTKLGQYTDYPPDSLDKTAQAVYDYCDDFRRVLRREATIETLADRADWAAKFSYILRRMNQDVQDGQPRSLTDYTSQAGDLQYDYMKISANNGRLQPIHLGYGYRLRNAGHFKHRGFTEAQLSKAYYQPPAETRAAIRGKIIKKYFVAECDWNYALVHDGSHRVKFTFNDVSQPSLDDEDAAILGDIKQRRN